MYNPKTQATLGTNTKTNKTKNITQKTKKDVPFNPLLVCEKIETEHIR